MGHQRRPPHRVDTSPGVRLGPLPFWEQVQVDRAGGGSRMATAETGESGPPCTVGIPGVTTVAVGNWEGAGLAGQSPVVESMG